MTSGGVAPGIAAAGYTALERRSEALSAYQRLKRMLSISLGVQPSAQTKRLYQNLKKQAVGG